MFAQKRRKGDKKEDVLIERGTNRIDTKLFSHSSNQAASATRNSLLFIYLFERAGSGESRNVLLPIASPQNENTFN